MAIETAQEAWARRTTSNPSWTRAKPLSGFLMLVPTLVGCVLLLAAAAKTARLRREGGPSDWLAAAVIQVELLCALGLLLGLSPRLTRWATLLLFVCFAAFTLHEVVAGAKLCGCVGDIPVKPFFAFSFDIVALLGLWFWQPMHEAGRLVCGRASWLASACSLIVFPALLWYFSHVPFPRLLLDSSIVDLGDVKHGEVREIVFGVSNPHDRAVSVERLIATCRCLKLQPRMGSISPGEKRYLNLLFDGQEESGFVGILAVEVSGFTGTGEIAFSAKVTARVLPPTNLPL